MTPDGPTYSDKADYSDGRLNAPSAMRNCAALTKTLASIATTGSHSDGTWSGTALEIASGTGQHVIHFAPAMPHLMWQPSDPNPERRASIAAWIQTEPSPNILSPIALDACSPGWSSDTKYDFIFVANLLHLVPVSLAQTCLQEMALALPPGGRAAVYGPFLRYGKTTSKGDAEFHARLQVENPGAGYKDLSWVHSIWTDAGLRPSPPIKMPANNLLLIADKAAP